MSARPSRAPFRPQPLGALTFSTVLGDCGIAWTDQGIVAVQLPETSAEATLTRLLSGLPACEIQPGLTPPANVQEAMAGVQALLAGDRSRHLREVHLDTRGVPEFACRVYELTRAIEPGQTRTYGELARELGEVGLSRAVGQALGANPFAPIIPCHRVLAAGDRSGGFSAHGGAEQKLRMLGIEGACIGGTLPLF